MPQVLSLKFAYQQIVLQAIFIRTWKYSVYPQIMDKVLGKNSLLAILLTHILISVEFPKVITEGLCLFFN